MTESNASSPESADDPTSEIVDETPDSAEAGVWTGSGDDLPELEELTPELVEEEAIRGDFMLRGAAILMAILFGFGQISDSRVLVHIRSGEDMQRNGFLPPRTDTFSHSREGLPTANVSWLFDHVVSLAWKLGGAQGLTFFKAGLAALIAWQLTRISVAGLPTWWNSICGVIALGACASDLMPITDLMTLLGLIVVLRLLHSAFEGNVDGLTWKAPLTIALWANLDARAWLGVFALLLFSAGRSFAKVPGDTRPGAAPGTMWAAAGISAVALLIHPFPIASVVSVVQTYWVEYPALRDLYPLSGTAVPLDGRTEYYSLFNDRGWDGFEFGYVAALTVILFAIMALVSYRDRREAPWAFVLTGFGVLAVVSIHELAAAALVAAAAASTVGQRWYQKTFSQEYTVKSSEVLFSRVGRAVTVFSFALLGFLVVTDRVPTRTAVGNGFTSDLQTTIDAFEKQLSQLPQDARVLHSLPSLGDFLIWNSRKSYIDSRITPFGPPDADDSAMRRYLTLRTGMLEAAEAAGMSQQPADPTFDDTVAESDEMVDIDTEFHTDGITHAIVGLYPPESPHYRTLRALGVDSGSWMLTSLGSSAAIFAWLKSINSSDDLQALDLVQTAFRDVEPVEEFRFEFAREKGFYNQYLYRTRKSGPEGLRIARHYLSAIQTPEGMMIAVRAANRLVTQDDQNAEGFFVLALAYSRLAGWEAQVAQQTGGRYAADMRYLQIVMACRQAVKIDPEHGGAWYLLYRIYAQRGRIDQALECLRRSIPYLERSQAAGSVSPVEQEQMLQETEAQLSDAVAHVNEQLDAALLQEFSGEPAELARHRHAIAQQAASAGHISAALNLLRENTDGLRANVPEIFPQAEAMRGQFLLETGALQEGYELFLQLDTMAENQESDSGSHIYPWSTMAFVAQIGLGNYDHASERMRTVVSEFKSNTSGPVIVDRSLRHMPLVAPIETTLRSTVVTQWPLSQLMHCLIPMQTAPLSHLQPRFMQAMAELEGGSVDAARISLQAIITEYGATPYRPLASVYLTKLQEDAEGFFEQNVTDLWEDWSEPEFETSTSDESEEPEVKELTTDDSDSETSGAEEPGKDESASEETSAEDVGDPVTEDDITEDSAANPPSSGIPAAGETETDESSQKSDD